jgi:integrase
MAERRHFGGIRKLPSGKFQAYYAGPDGGRRTAPFTFDTRKAADDWLSTVRADLQRGTWRKPELARQRFDQFAVAWISSREDLKLRTKAYYASLLDLHLIPAFGFLELRQIDPQTVRQWHIGGSETMGAITRARAYSLLRAVMNQAIRDGAVASNPCNIRGAGSVPSPEKRPASIAEVNAIADGMPARYRMLVLCGAWSGLRLGELTGLRRQDVDLERMTFRVERSVGAIHGYGMVVDKPKSEAGKRLVHVPNHLTDDLRDHFEKYVRGGEDALVFGTAPGNYITASNIRKYLKRAAAEVGRDDLTFHSLRHTGATLAAQAGATTRELMERLGHSTPRAAMIYQHATHERDQAIADALAAAATAGNVIALRSPRKASAS